MVAMNLRRLGVCNKFIQQILRHANVTTTMNIYMKTEWRGYHSLRRGIATQLNTITRDPMAAKGPLRHAGVNTTLTH
jgi:hypothetical protein